MVVALQGKPFGVSGYLIGAILSGVNYTANMFAFSPTVREILVGSPLIYSFSFIKDVLLIALAGIIVPVALAVTASYLFHYEEIPNIGW